MELTISFYPFQKAQEKLFTAFTDLQEIAKIDEMISNVLSFQEEFIQGMQMKISEKEKRMSTLHDPSDVQDIIPTLPAPEPGENGEDLEDMVMFLKGNGPPGPFDDIIAGSLDLSLNGQWSQL